MISLLNISDTVEICITDKMLNNHFYKTKIVDLFEDDGDDIVVTMLPSSERGIPVAFFKDTPYKLYAKFDDGIIVWQIQYLGTDREDSLIECVFKIISTPEVTQRREYFRQPVAMAIDFHKIDKITGAAEDANEYTNPDAIEENTGQIMDMSGGGCAFFSNDFITLGTILESYFMFKERPFKFKAQVLDRTDFIKAKSKYKYKYRVSWMDAKDREVDALIRLLFEQQRDLIAKNKSIIETLENRRARLWE